MSSLEIICERLRGVFESRAETKEGLALSEVSTLLRMTETLDCALRSGGARTEKFKTDFQYRPIHVSGHETPLSVAAELRRFSESLRGTVESLESEFCAVGQSLDFSGLLSMIFSPFFGSKVKFMIVSRSVEYRDFNLANIKTSGFSPQTVFDILDQVLSFEDPFTLCEIPKNLLDLLKGHIRLNSHMKYFGISFMVSQTRKTTESTVIYLLETPSGFAPAVVDFFRSKVFEGFVSGALNCAYRCLVLPETEGSRGTAEKLLADLLSAFVFLGLQTLKFNHATSETPRTFQFSGEEGSAVVKVKSLDFGLVPNDPEPRDPKGMSEEVAGQFRQLIRSLEVWLLELAARKSAKEFCRFEVCAKGVVSSVYVSDEGPAEKFIQNHESFLPGKTLLYYLKTPSLLESILRECAYDRLVSEKSCVRKFLFKNIKLKVTPLRLLGTSATPLFSVKLFTNTSLQALMDDQTEGNGNMIFCVPSRIFDAESENLDPPAETQASHLSEEESISEDPQPQNPSPENPTKSDSQPDLQDKENQTQNSPPRSEIAKSGPRFQHRKTKFLFHPTAGSVARTSVGGFITADRPTTRWLAPVAPERPAESMETLDPGRGLKRGSVLTRRSMRKNEDEGPSAELDKTELFSTFPDLLDRETSLLQWALHMMGASGLRLDESKLRRFLRAAQALHDSQNNAFHNFSRAVSSLQFVFRVVESEEGRRHLDEVACLAALFAGLVNNLDHPGVNNYFHTATVTPLALKYNGISVNENHHAATAFRLLLEPQNNFVSFLSPAEFARFREMVIESILATDPSNHFELLAKLQNLYEVTSQAEKTLLLAGLLHFAELSYAAKPSGQAIRWNQRLFSEQLKQLAEERKRSIPVSPALAQLEVPANKAFNEVLFLQKIARPLAVCMNRLFQGRFVEDIANLDENIVYLQSL